MKNTASAKFFCVIDHLIIQLTYPEFYFKTESKVDSLTGLQRMIKVTVSFKWMLTIFTRTLPWALNSLRNKFQLEKRG